MLTDINAIARQFDLRRVGSEYKGPCPICGGETNSTSNRVKVSSWCTVAMVVSLRSWLELRASGRTIAAAPGVEVGAVITAPNPRAAAAWALTREAQRDHPYLSRKAIQPHGIGVAASDFEYAPVNVRGRGNLLVVPSYLRGQLTTLQFIAEDGTKGFLRGAPQSGVNFTLFGSDTVWVVEGFATGASLTGTL